MSGIPDVLLQLVRRRGHARLIDAIAHATRSAPTRGIPQTEAIAVLAGGRRSGLVITLGVGLCLAACSSEKPVDLLIYEGAIDGCSVSGGYTLDLVVDPTSGTVAGANVEVGGMYPSAGDGPIWWPPGYTARRDGLAIVILDPDGTERARTGSRYVVGLPFDVRAARNRLVACFIGPAPA